MVKQEFFKLNNGHEMPGVAIVGTGTKWHKVNETDENFSQTLVDQLKYALSLPGVVHLDAAEFYMTYREVGRALAETSKPRDEIFITDKYWTLSKVTENPIVGLETGLKRLGLEYVDLYLLHSPFISKETNGFSLEEAWGMMEELYHSGKAKNIGVSNFAKEDLERVLKVCKVKPQVNQIEFNAFLQNQTPGIYNFCKQNDIQLAAYSPLGPLQKKPADGDSQPFYSYVNKLAQHYNKTPGQVLLRWVTKRGVVAVTTSEKKERIKQAQEIFEFDLKDDEVTEITKLGLDHEPLRLYWHDQYNKYNSESQKA
ncbi:Aldo/keto reductase family signature 2 [Nakaseomyces glabratus]|nr:Aldo/keto reductase family signature 2 [Nakaseomyces glabratus]KAH7585457.1 Aldo/keto reductase family signature 2 [Nakaseomyces glabratus]